MNSRVVLIAGAGGVLGTALVQEFVAAGYSVAGLRRSNAHTALSEDADAMHMHYCNLQDAIDIKHTIKQVISEYGEIDVLVYNAAQLVIAPFLELTSNDFENTWHAAVSGAVACAQAVLPDMLRRKNGVMIFSGATSSTRGSARFAAFASAKFALRGLTQSLAREYQSQGIHVAHVVLDGLLRGSASIQKFGGHEDKSIDPAVVASTYRWLAEQPASAWTMELDLRPSAERF